ncbi:protease inhibitors-like [Photinus pyralis]|uniref:protease inhibitors-like n=1 Tax=Photinus pyralis TaxID=7054 RepID=UPI0012670E2A|nr:protease inhibitors-like [Photinus pyralis]XP_031357389.1 protease inhibitors-like [Photinus pyralis]XP_031357442.1 protease inhibitors-like [Photinus pyralis]
MKLAILLVICTVVVCTSANFVCKVGVPYKQNECNDCVCDTSGTLGCTDKHCSGTPTTLVHCSVGETHLKNCNTCWCVKDYGTVCTNKKC